VAKDKMALVELGIEEKYKLVTFPFKTEDFNMVIFKKMIKMLAILLVSLIFLILVLTLPTRPSKVQLCRDVEGYLPKAECMKQENAVQIVKRAFPEGEVSSSDVKSALGEYLHAEYITPYGYREVYYLSVRPIDFLLNYFDSYDFRYDNNGVLISFSYDDF
jgi:hypothetical protein